jgi:hypothetical protein
MGRVIEEIIELEGDGQLELIKAARTLGTDFTVQVPRDINTLGISNRLKGTV